MTSRCIHCREAIGHNGEDDSILFIRNGKTVALHYQCGTCAVCGQNFIENNDFMYYEGKFYHRSCEQCSICRTEYTLETKGRPTPNCKCMSSCIICNEQIRKNKNKIIKKYIIFEDETVAHTSCLECKFCGVVGSVSSENQLVLECNCIPSQCYICTESIGSDSYRFWKSISGSTEYAHDKCLFEKMCLICNKVIGNGIPVSYENEFRHKDCHQLLCAVCHHPIEKDNIYNFKSSCTDTNVPIHELCRSVIITPERCEKCSNKIINPLGFFPIMWNKKTHIFFPPEIQLAIRQIFMMHRRRNSIFSILPRDILHYISKWTATPNGWLILWGFNMSNNCARGKCREISKCSLCKIEMSWCATQNQCTNNKCCTYLRLCICVKGIRHNIIDPLNECTDYRCVKMKCKTCNLEIQPDPNDRLYSTMCSKVCCQTVVTTRNTKIRTIGTWLNWPESKIVQLKDTKLENIIVQMWAAHAELEAKAVTTDNMMRCQAIGSAITHLKNM